MVLLYLLDVLLPFSLSSAASVAAAVVLAVNLPFIGKTFRLPAWAFFLIGAGVLLACRRPPWSMVPGAPVHDENSGHPHCYAESLPGDGAGRL